MALGKMTHPMAAQMTLGSRRLTDRRCTQMPLMAGWMTAMMAQPRTGGSQLDD